jgi:flagellar biosynthesis protein FlhF
MKIVRHIAPDMRQALRAIREKLGEDAVILSSRRIPEGVEITAAIDFDASALQDAMNTPAGSLTAAPLPAHPAAASRALAAAPAAPQHVASQHVASQHLVTTHAPTSAAAGYGAPAAAPAQMYGTPVPTVAAAPVQMYGRPVPTSTGPAPSYAQLASDPAAVAYSHAAAAPPRGIPSLAAQSPPPGISSLAAQSHYFPAVDARPFAHILSPEPIPAPQAHASTYAQPNDSTPLQATAAPARANAQTSQAAPSMASARLHAPAPQPAAAATMATTPKAPASGPMAPAGDSLASRSVAARREPILNIPVNDDLAAETLAQLPAAPAPGSDTTGSELKTLRRMLETQLAQLAWNDLTRRAPVHVEILRELTEIGISQELSDYILKQLPEKVELGFARRFAIAGLSQYLLVTGDRWLENGGRVAFIGATGVGKTTTLAKLAVRWVLRHGPRDLALVGSDTVRIGAQDQIQSLGQLLGAPVYTPDNFESLPTLLERLGRSHRMILIDTPGSSLRDARLLQRLSILSNCASQMESALVLGASTQAGALEETLKRFAPANPACCVLTKLDEAASLGGALSALIKARLPVSYLSEGQRVPEDLRPARALELVSTAVRLAKASGATADEDLLRRRFGKTAHAIT